MQIAINSTTQTSDTNDFFPYTHCTMASQNRPQSFYEGSFRLSSGSQVQPQPHHRHQASLEDIINCSQLGPLTTDERSRARGALNDIIDHVSNHVGSKSGYSRHLLVRHTYEYSRSEMSKDTFLRVFFNIMGLDISSSEDINTDDSQIRQKFIDFADMLLEQFFFPCLCYAHTYDFQIY